MTKCRNIILFFDFSPEYNVSKRKFRKRNKHDKSFYLDAVERDQIIKKFGEGNLKTQIIESSIREKFRFCLASLIM